MIAVVAELVADEKVNEEDGRHGDGKAGDVDEGRELVPEDGAQCDFEVVPDHGECAKGPPFEALC